MKSRFPREPVALLRRCPALGSSRRLARVFSISTLGFVAGCGGPGDALPPSSGGSPTQAGGSPSAGGFSAGTGGSGSPAGGASTAGSGAGGRGLVDGGAPAIPSGGAGASGGDASGSGGSTSGGSMSGGSTSGGAPSGGGGTAPAGGAGPISVFVAGDSTVSNYADTASPLDQAGWGQMLPELFDARVTVDNRARGGRTALWFFLEGGVESILQSARPGDYFLVQFGTNDSHKTATFEVNGVTYPRYADPATDFKAQLIEHYLNPARAKALEVVLVTPPPRNSAYCGTGNSLGAYAQAMREVGAAEDVPVLDLNQRTFDFLSAICPSPTPEDFFFIKTDGNVDGTHFQENGARHMAAFLGEEAQRLSLPLAGYLRP